MTVRISYYEGLYGFVVIILYMMSLWNITRGVCQRLAFMIPEYIILLCQSTCYIIILLCS